MAARTPAASAATPSTTASAAKTKPATRKRRTSTKKGFTINVKISRAKVWQTLGSFVLVSIWTTMFVLIQVAQFNPAYIVGNVIGIVLIVASVAAKNYAQKTVMTSEFKLLFVAFMVSMAAIILLAMAFFMFVAHVPASATIALIVGVISTLLLASAVILDNQT